MATSSAQRRRIAALDVGTNTVLMLVVEVDEGNQPRPIAEMGEVTRLGRGVDRSHRLDPQPRDRTLEVIAKFVERARLLGAANVLSAATSALRDADDGPEFVAQVKQRTGVELEVVGGEAEAELGYLAVRYGLNIEPTTRLLVADIGGGSTELVWASPGAPIDVKSLKIGSVRLTERIIRSDPPTRAEMEQLRGAIDRSLATLGERWSTVERLVGVAGTVTTICTVALGLRSYDHATVHGHELSYDEVAKVLARLMAVTLPERKRLPGMVEGRADVIIAGATILERVMTAFQVDKITVSDQGIRWGLIYRDLKRGGSQTP